MFANFTTPPKRIALTAANYAIDMALIATCPSRWLLDFCALPSGRVARYRNPAMSAIHPRRDIAGGHRALIEAAIHGEVAEAVTKLVEHYRRTAEMIVKSE